MTTKHASDYAALPWREWWSRRISPTTKAAVLICTHGDFSPRTLEDDFRAWLDTMKHEAEAFSVLGKAREALLGQNAKG